MDPRMSMHTSPGDPDDQDILNALRIAIWQKGAEVKVLSHHLGSWVSGHVTSPRHNGKLTVTYKHEDQTYRQHLRPGAYGLSPLAKSVSFSAEDIKEAEMISSSLEAMPLNPNSKFAVISAHEFANHEFAEDSRRWQEREMQDRHTIIDPWGPRRDMAFLGVYDGHGGSVASEYCKKKLHRILWEELEELETPTDVDFAIAFARTFARVDENLRSMGVEDGTTATVAVLHHPDPNEPATVHFANVGDSPAILFGGRPETPIAMYASVDDNVGRNEKEKLRIQAEGWGKVGKYIEVEEPEHSDLLRLQTTRSLGDFQFKQHPNGPVISRPSEFGGKRS
eukprot:TRINITY_DN1138_c1_g1_i2.p1 TRINITY_DN1138_c1_g1~~TRINITY_DN1138_c1_g1_i2.p1  ORF type:complete len:359 (+),score=55.07 TRINITY_DN1138_c1_g1_i2:69-1079(+)